MEVDAELVAFVPFSNDYYKQIPWVMPLDNPFLLHFRDFVIDDCLHYQITEAETLFDGHSPRLEKDVMLSAIRGTDGAFKLGQFVRQKFVDILFFVVGARGAAAVVERD